MIDGSTIPLSWALTMGKPAKILASTRPTARLLGPETIASVVGQILINIVFAIIVTSLLFGQSFFLCNEFDGRLVDVRQWWTLSDNFESAATSMICTFQIINAAAAFNIGSTYRKGFFRNISFLVLYSALFAVLSVILLADPNSFGCLFRVNCGNNEALERLGYSKPWFFGHDVYYSAIGHNVMPMKFRWILWGIAVANLITVVSFEAVVILGPVRSFLKRSRPLIRLEMKR